MRKRGDEWETPDAVENDDGGLSAPLMYASLVLGMITVWKKDMNVVTESFEGEGMGSMSAEETPVQRPAVWSEQVRWLEFFVEFYEKGRLFYHNMVCLLYTSDAADE